MTYSVRIDQTSYAATITGQGETIVVNTISGSHTHALADLRQDGATNGQAIAWSTSLGKWAPATFSGGGGSASWGGITGTLSAQTDLNSALAAKQPLATVLTNTTASYTTAEQTKLAGIATGATANSADATLLARANHTGTQLAATISDFSTAVAATAAVAANTAKISNATHTGDVTGSTALTLATVNSNVGSFGSATQASTFTVNAKGLVTAAGAVTITPAYSSITGLPTTVSGYGITDAVTLTGAQTVAGVKSLTSELSLANVASPTTPAAGFVDIFAATYNGQSYPAFMSQDGIIRPIIDGNTRGRNAARVQGLGAI